MELIYLNKKERKTIKRYDEIAPVYNIDWRGKHDKVQLAHLQKFEKLLGNPPKKILDAGCGTGKDCFYFASRKYEIYGIDLSKEMLKAAYEKFKNGNLKVKFFIEDMRHLHFPNNYFDGVWTTAAIVHLDKNEKEKAIREFYRVLKPNGYLHIWVQNFLSPKHIFRFFQSYFNWLQVSEKPLFKKILFLKKRITSGYTYIDRRHWFYPTKSGLIKILQKNGFLVLETNHRFSRRLSIYAQKN